MPPFDYRQKYNVPRDPSGVMFQDPRQAYTSMLQARGYNPNYSILGRYSLAAHAPQLQSLAYAMAGKGAVEGGEVDNFGALMNQWFDQNLTGRYGQNINPGGAYDLSDRSISDSVQSLLQPGAGGGDGSDDYRQSWLRSLGEGGPLARVQALEDLSRGGMLPGFREAHAALRGEQYNDWWQNYITAQRDKAADDLPTFIDVLQGRTTPWKGKPLGGGAGGAGGTGAEVSTGDGAQANQQGGYGTGLDAHSRGSQPGTQGGGYGAGLDAHERARLANTGGASAYSQSAAGPQGSLTPPPRGVLSPTLKQYPVKPGEWGPTGYEGELVSERDAELMPLDAAGDEFGNILSGAGIRPSTKKGSLFRGGMYSGHPDAPARTSFGFGDYDYDAARDTGRRYNVKGAQGGSAHWGSAVNVALRRFAVFKRQGMDDVSAWNAAVQWMMQHAPDAARTGFRRRSGGGGAGRQTAQAG